MTLPLETSRVALVTGASSGIGHATALAFTREGTRVAAVARSIERLNTLKATAPDLILPIAADVTDGEKMRDAVGLTI